MKTLAEIRAELKAQDEKAKAIKDGTYTGGGDGQPDAFLAHWNIAEGAPLNLRFLEDGDKSNPVFWRERTMIKLPFRGVKGVHNDMTFVTVPCNEMWGPKDSCPVRKEVRGWYKSLETTPDEDLKKLASTYWGSKSYLLQCLIAPESTPVLKDNPPENPVRRVLLSKQLFTKVRSILLNTGIREFPTHPEFGRDFTIVKQKNGGGYAAYDESQFCMSERPWNDEERAAIEQYGLFDLGEYMPKQPTQEELQAIAEMFEASVNGEAYDPTRWAFAYRPAGVQRPTGDAPASIPPVAQSSTPVSTPSTPVVESAPVVETKVETTPVTQPEVKVEKTSSSTADLLARLKTTKK